MKRSNFTEWVEQNRIKNKVTLIFRTKEEAEKYAKKYIIPTKNKGGSTLNIIKNYQKALQELYDHVGFKEDWVICPIDDCTDKYWKTDERTSVIYGETKKDVIEENGSHYSDEIYTQRFYKKWVYRGKDYTMIFCDPHVDGMKWFRIFDNKKKVQL